MRFKNVIYFPYFSVQPNVSENHGSRKNNRNGFVFEILILCFGNTNLVIRTVIQIERYVMYFAEV